MLERLPHVVDVQEQFPIFDITRTQQICAEVGIRHKFRKGNPEPYTIDFLITERHDGEDQLRAASLKAFDFELTPQIQAKLSVEHRWCQENRIPWELVNWEGIPHPDIALSVLRYLRQWHTRGFQTDTYKDAKYVEHFNHIFERNVPLRVLLEKTARRLKIPFQKADDAFRFAAWHKRISVSLNHELALNLPLVPGARDAI